jgi:hypothetical protein
MIGKHAIELKQVLVAVFATAASMGIDIDELSEQAAADLGEEQVGLLDQFKPSAVDKSRYCCHLVKGDLAEF